MPHIKPKEKHESTCTKDVRKMLMKLPDQH